MFEDRSKKEIVAIEKLIESYSLEEEKYDTFQI